VTAKNWMVALDSSSEILLLLQFLFPSFISGGIRIRPASNEFGSRSLARIQRRVVMARLLLMLVANILELVVKDVSACGEARALEAAAA
jgi:hypothetical protein